MEEKHLWEADHPYYCNLGNYFSNGEGLHFKTWQDFINEFGDADLDMNLLFRWDWILPEKPSEDPYYRDGDLQVFWMGQRKGKYFFSQVSVCKADEPEVKVFLLPRLEHLKKLWEPLT